MIHVGAKEKINCTKFKKQIETKRYKDGTNIRGGHEMRRICYKSGYQDSRRKMKYGGEPIGRRAIVSQGGEKEKVGKRPMLNVDTQGGE